MSFIFFCAVRSISLHNWFQNGLYTIKANPTNAKHISNTVLENQKVLEGITECHQSGKLNEALPDVPDDIMLFLSRYCFPVKQLAERLENEDFIKYYESAIDNLQKLMKKYGAD